jgi:hypothetical protein
MRLDRLAGRYRTRRVFVYRMRSTNKTMQGPQNQVIRGLVREPAARYADTGGEALR